MISDLLFNLDIKFHSIHDPEIRNEFLLFVGFSTVAASINALATVAYEDFVSQCFRNLSNKATMWISKALCKYNHDLTFTFS